MIDSRVQNALEMLDLHYESFYSVEPYATSTGHPVPTDTRGWSQVLVSVLTGVKGLERKKGPDLEEGSDVKGANTWESIDTPRFNGVIKAGTLATTSGQMASLDAMPNLYLVLWDATTRDTVRCRIWVVRPKYDQVFRAMCSKWYSQRAINVIKSSNFQLHPPRGYDSNTIRNNCGNLSYPLCFSAERAQGCTYKLIRYIPLARFSGSCVEISQYQ